MQTRTICVPQTSRQGYVAACPPRHSCYAKTQELLLAMSLHASGTGTIHDVGLLTDNRQIRQGYPKEILESYSHTGV